MSKVVLVEGLPPLTPRVELRHDIRVDVPVTIGLGAGLVVWRAVANDVLPSECRWCDGAPGEVNAVDDFFRTALRRPDPKPAIVMSDVLGYGVGPVVALGLGVVAAGADRRVDEAPINLLLTLEASLVALSMSEAIKAIALRERPDFHALDPEAKKAVPASDEPLLSFPSGHPMFVFAMTASSATIASMRGYRLAPLIWGVGSAIGLATAYGRIAADRHYFTDVMTGIGIGIGVGALVPWLFHGPTEPRSELARYLHRSRLMTSSVPGGRVISVGFAF